MAGKPITDADDAWRLKAHNVIAEHCRAAYLVANRKADGTMRRKHVPYHVPEIATALVRALASNDEHEAKRLFQVERTGSWTLI